MSHYNSKGKGSIVHSQTTIGHPSTIGPNAYIGPYTSIGDHTTIRNTEIENNIIMEGAHIDCGRRIVGSLIGMKVTILSHEQNVPKGHKLILGDMAAVTL